jgi:hypothetical protein
LEPWIGQDSACLGARFKGQRQASAREKYFFCIERMDSGEYIPKGAMIWEIYILSRIRPGTE